MVTFLWCCAGSVGFVLLWGVRCGVLVKALFLL